MNTFDKEESMKYKIIIGVVAFLTGIALGWVLSGYGEKKTDVKWHYTHAKPLQSNMRRFTTLLAKKYMTTRVSDPKMADNSRVKNQVRTSSM